MALFGKLSLRSLLFMIAMVLAILAVASAFEVELYEHKHFRGRHTSVDVRGCTNLPYEWDDIASSIDTNQCVLVFKHPNCQGPRVRLEPYGFGTAYLREINFEDKLSSLAPCNFAGSGSARERDEY